MQSDFVLALISRDDFSEYRIREINEILQQALQTIFILATPSKSSFQRYAKDLEQAPIYNSDGYIPQARLLDTSWGFNAIWIFHESSFEVFQSKGITLLPNVSSWQTPQPGLGAAA